MPTNQKEAKKIYQIINEYIGPKIAKELTSRLSLEVGKESDNESLRVSLEMLSSLYNIPSLGTRDCAALHHDD